MKIHSKRGISSGTIVFLCLTLGVIAVAFFFLLAISGKDLSEGHETNAGQITEALENMDLPDDAEQRLPGEGRPVVILNSEATPAEPEVKHLTICMAGDVTAPRIIRQTKTTEKGDTDFSDVFVNLNDLFTDADISLATLETMTDDERDYDTYNTSPSLLDALREAGIHYLNLATEHMLDYGDAGLEMTRAELNIRGINYCGASGTYHMLSVNGINIAILTYTYGISDAIPETQDVSGVPFFLLERALSDIALARANGANLVIVLPHWGTKNSGEVSESMRETALQLAKAGADMIIGSHPNVVSEMEILKTERVDGREYETLVCYSLGALLMDARSKDNAAGMVLRTELQYDSGARQVVFLSNKAVPLYIGQDTADGDRVWRVVNASDSAYLDGLSVDFRESALAARTRVEALAAGLENGNAKTD